VTTSEGSRPLLTRGYLSKESIALVPEDQGDGSGGELAALEG
jgi:hypothetical protein